MFAFVKLSLSDLGMPVPETYTLDFYFLLFFDSFDSLGPDLLLLGDFLFLADRDVTWTYKLG